MNASILALVELTTKGTAVVLAGYGCAILFARESAAQRSLCWLGVFATMLLLPVALLVRPVWGMPVPTASQPAHEATTAEALTDAPEAAAPAAQPRFSLSQWLGALYGCGMAVVLGFRLLGAAQLWKLRRESMPDPEGQAIVDGWRREVQLRRPVRVCASPRVTVPMTCGTWRPLILLPTTSLGQSAAERHAVLLHEFSHIRHGDAARRWLGTLVTALWWAHPLVWAAFRAWKLEQERACDDAVLNSGADAAGYAQQLLDVACHARLSRFQSASALVMAMPGGLETRLRSVTSPQVNRSPARLVWLLPIGAIALAVTFGGIAVQAQAAAPATPGAGAKAMKQKAEAMVIPVIEDRDSTVESMLQEITTKSGIKIFYTPRKDDPTRISLTLRNVPASEAIQYVASLSNLSVTYKDDGVYLTDLGAAGAPPRAAQAGPAIPGLAPAEPLMTREWKIPRNFIPTAPNSAKPLSAVEALTAAGVVFPPGSAGVYSQDKSRLIVKNTQANLDLIDVIVERRSKKAVGPAR